MFRKTLIWLYAGVGLTCIIIGAIIISYISPQVFGRVVTSISDLITPQRIYTDGQIFSVMKVVDGDTIELSNGEKVRLLNIDTPETVKEQTPVMCWGPEASSFAKQLMPAGSKVVIKLDKENRDKYGRLLAFVFGEGSDNERIENSYNAQLIKLGYARSLIIKPNNTYERYFRGLEVEAKQAKIGVWNCEAPFIK